ncbi:hypothetical protein [Streptomyces sp. NPDC088261]|uniref:hypothetical protein n=1 Tax=Streptomyces sp. NPDC088261 TaxID=3365851 RepID=UPI0038231352
MPLSPIRAARAVQILAARAALTCGLAHPATRTLLAVAASVAARAWEAGHRVHDVHPAPQLVQKDALVADDLYTRYMKAFQALNAHRAACGTCTDAVTCEAGAPLDERFTRLQDAYRARQSKQR